MTSILILVGCAVLPVLLCATLRRVLLRPSTVEPSVASRLLGRFRRATLIGGIVCVVGAGVVGALGTDPALFPRRPAGAAWFFSSLCLITAWASMSICQRTPDEAVALTPWETFGRAVQTSMLGITATGVSIALVAVLQPALPLPEAVSALLCALLCVLAVVVFSPWLMMLIRIWPVFPTRLQVDGVSWRLAHLPAPTPFLTHVAALPWLRTVLLTDGLFKRVPERHWRTLVTFEVTGATTARLERTLRWAFAIPLSILVFTAATVAGQDDPKKLVASLSLAVAFALSAAWVANRQEATGVSMDRAGPSPQDLAQTLRQLPPNHGQAMPRTSHKPLGTALYDRLFALGHDPGPRRRG